MTKKRKAKYLKPNTDSEPEADNSKGWKTIAVVSKGTLRDPESGQILSKCLKIDLDKPVPEFKFFGAWTGHDIRVVQRHLVREYRIWQRDKRRNEAKKEDAPQQEVLA